MDEGSLAIETANFGGWPNCIRLSNGDIELVATTDVGPRIIRLGFVGGQNLFKNYEATLGRTGGKEGQGEKKRRGDSEYYRQLRKGKPEESK